MKKAIAALSAAGLAIGIVGTFGATAVTASVRPHGTPPPVFAVTLVKSTGYSTTRADKIKIDYSGATHKDALLFGVCNDDASQTSPLISLTDACTSPKELLASKTGAGSATVTFTPGQIGSDSLSSCPQTTGQYGLGIACIVAAEDISANQVADAPFYFTPPKPNKPTGTKGNATISVNGGFATDGLYGTDPANLTTGCQAFSAAEPAAAWSTEPLCSDGANTPAGLGGPLPEGYGFATGEPVEVWSGPYGTGTLLCNPTVAPGGTGACPYADADAPAPVTTPGGASIALATLGAGSLPDNSTNTFTLVGASSGVAVTVTVKVGAKGKVS
ncbi:MAG: hypothetical protein ABSD78_06710 [Acidimicrobiales bacterium]|jgi:hypothetical protein